MSVSTYLPVMFFLIMVSCHPKHESLVAEKSSPKKAGGPEKISQKEVAKKERMSPTKFEGKLVEKTLSDKIKEFRYTVQGSMEIPLDKKVYQLEHMINLTREKLAAGENANLVARIDAILGNSWRLKSILTLTPMTFGRF